MTQEKCQNCSQGKIPTWYLWAIIVLSLCAFIAYLLVKKPNEELKQVQSEIKSVEASLDGNTTKTSEVKKTALKKSESHVKRADSVIQGSKLYVPVKDEAEAMEYLSNYPKNK